MDKLSTPWGPAHTLQVIDPARQIVHVTTAEHGGYGVSNALPLPKCLAGLGVVEGDYRWFEEDSCWCAVPIAFPKYFSPATLASAMDTLRNDHPSAYQIHFRVHLKPEESRALEQARWDESTRNSFTLSAGFTDAWDIPAGHVYAVGWRRADEATAGFLVPAADYEATTRLVLDSYPRWEPNRTLSRHKAPNEVTAA